MTLTAQALTLPKMLEERLAHLTPNERAALAALVDRLRQRYGDDLLRVVLYGSKARGDFDDESDLDVLIVVRMPDNDYWRHWREIHGAIRRSPQEASKDYHPCPSRKTRRRDN